MDAKRLPFLLAIVVITFCSALIFEASKGVTRVAWDRVAYIGLVFEHRGYSVNEARVATFADLRQELDKDEYAYITGRTFGEPYHARYRIGAETDDQVFGAQLPFYRSRYVYVGLLDWMNRAGLTFYTSIGILSLVPSLAIIVAVGMMALRSRAYLAGLFAVPVAFFSMDWYWVPYLGSPDALACFFFAMGCYGVFRSSRSWLGHLGLLASVSIRPDMALFACFVLAVPLLTQKHKWISMASMAASCLLAYLLERAGGAYSLATLIYHSVAHPMLRPDVTKVAWTLKDHASLIFESRWKLFQNVWPVIPLAAAGLVVSKRWKTSALLGCCGLLSVLARYALVPHVEGRYFLAAIVMVACGSIALSWTEPVESEPLS